MGSISLIINVAWKHPCKKKFKILCSDPLSDNARADMFGNLLMRCLRFRLFTFHFTKNFQLKRLK